MYCWFHHIIVIWVSYDIVWSETPIFTNMLNVFTII